MPGASLTVAFPPEVVLNERDFPSEASRKHTLLKPTSDSYCRSCAVLIVEDGPSTEIAPPVLAAELFTKNTSEF